MYLFDGRCIADEDLGFEAVLALAHAERVRPICACRSVPMCVARLPNGYVVKRMPYTGSQHSPACVHYESEPPRATRRNGEGQDDGANPRLAFSLLEFSPSRQSSGHSRGRLSGHRDGLSLEQLLRHLWEAADLNRWHPGFAGKRTWAVVRSHLLRAADSMSIEGINLSTLLYIPEVFSVERREEIEKRRLQRIAELAPSETPRWRYLLIAELKELRPGHAPRLFARHLPDHPFEVAPDLYWSLTQQCQSAKDVEPAHWQRRVVLIAMVRPAESAPHVIAEAAVIQVQREWIPFRSREEFQWIGGRIRGGMPFDTLPSARRGRGESSLRIF